MTTTLNLDLATALDIKLAAEQEAKFQALRNLHSSKIKLLTGSLDAKEKEITKLKVLNKDNRRTQMIEAYKSKIKDLELVIDVLKSELSRKGEMSPEEVNDFIILKTISGPKRFRPQTREELEKTIADLERKLKKATTSAANAAAAAASNTANDTRSVAGSVAGSTKGSRPLSAAYTNPRAVPSDTSAAPIINRGCGTNAPSRIEDITQIATLSHDLSAIKTALEVANSTIDSQRDEISRLRMRNAELCVVEEESDFQERQYKELRVLYESVTEELTEVTKQLSIALNQNVQLQTTIDVETEAFEVDRDNLVDHCDKVLRQNSALLQKLSELEGELGTRILPNDGVGLTNRKTSLSHGNDGGGSASSMNKIAQLEQKIAKLTEKLKTSEQQVASLQVELAQVNELKDQLRDKNILIRELQVKIPAPGKQTRATADSVDSKSVEQNLREENERLKKALHIAASESLAASRSVGKSSAADLGSGSGSGSGGNGGGLRESKGDYKA